MSVSGQPSGLIIDASTSQNGTTYTNGISNPIFQTSILCSKTDQLPNIRNSLYLGQTGFTNQGTSSGPTRISSCLIANSSTQGLAYGGGYTNCIILKTSNDYMDTSMENCLMIGGGGRAIYASTQVLKMGMTLPAGHSYYMGCVFNAYDTTFTTTDSQLTVEGVVILGTKHGQIDLSHGRHKGYTVLGRAADTSDTNDKLVVGCGTATNNLQNCFTTGNDGTDDYIKIGETKLTETQLTALIALLS